MADYVVFTEGRKGSLNERYWTGDFTDAGMPQTTPWLKLAAKFDSARAAYDCADGQRKLRWWRVGRR